MTIATGEDQMRRLLTTGGPAAVQAAPTVVDATGLLIYFQVARWIMGMPA